MPRDVSEQLSAAWAAVQASGVPPELYEVAFREAISLQANEGSHKSSTPTASLPPPSPPHNELAMGMLVTESGVSETDLSDIFQFKDGNIHILTATKDLGTSKSAQARTMIALLASARRYVLSENPVDADAVRTELKRKGAFDATNFAQAHLGKMKGFKAGSSSKEIVLTSKWVDEFKSAVNQAHGRQETSL